MSRIGLAPELVLSEHLGRSQVPESWRMLPALSFAPSIQSCSTDWSFSRAFYNETSMQKLGKPQLLLQRRFFSGRSRE